MAAPPQPPPDARLRPTRLDSALRQPRAGNRRRAAEIRLPAGDHTPGDNQTLSPGNSRDQRRGTSQTIVPAAEKSLIPVSNQLMLLLPLLRPLWSYLR